MVFALNARFGVLVDVVAAVGWEEDRRKDQQFINLYTSVPFHDSSNRKSPDVRSPHSNKET